MTAAQSKTLENLVASWTESGYGKATVYEAQDSEDVLIVATSDDPDRPPVAARINPLGSAKAGPATSPGMGTPLKPLSPDHPNYEWEQQQAASA